MTGKMTVAFCFACLALAGSSASRSVAQSATVVPAPVPLLPATVADGGPASSGTIPAGITPAKATTASAEETARYVSIARRELERLGSEITKQDRVAIVDFSRPSDEPRLFLIDLGTGRVGAYRVTHGKGSDPTGTGRLAGFSSLDGSEATSRGAYRTAELYAGQHGRSMRLDGLDPDNRTARGRAIVVHAAAYAEPSVVKAQGRLGRSQGCFAVSSGDLDPVLNFLGQGRLLFADRL